MNMAKNGDQPSRPGPQGASWVIVGHCPQCGNPIYSKSSDFAVVNPPQEVLAFSRSWPMPPIAQRTCDCQAMNAARTFPGGMKLGGSFQFALDDEARAVLARVAAGDDDRTIKATVPTTLPPIQQQRPLGGRPDWMTRAFPESPLPVAPVAPGSEEEQSL